VREKRRKKEIKGILRLAERATKTKKKKFTLIHKK